MMRGVLLCLLAAIVLQNEIESESSDVFSDKGLLNLFNKCYDEYGCFTTLPPFGGTWERPIALLPQSPSTVLTRFFLYTREHHGAIEIGRQKTNLGLGTW
ncbi:unnamed protein product [Rotaria magnacalcarata]|uniref:Uncharacterized protein n=1 Tax=Rotaria magnacalcarata TaxID=392030 RepID=A0A815UHS4_9BILA|nr:unnamed protein product [Rotaria magnacalcarata]